MAELKTLKDLIFDTINVSKNYQTGIIREDEIKAEAVKRIKKCCKCYKPYKEICKACARDIWFNNITEENLK